MTPKYNPAELRVALKIPKSEPLEVYKYKYGTFMGRREYIFLNDIVPGMWFMPLDNLHDSLMMGARCLVTEVADGKIKYDIYSVGETNEWNKREMPITDKYMAVFLPQDQTDEMLYDLAYKHGLFQKAYKERVKALLTEWYKKSEETQ